MVRFKDVIVVPWMQDQGEYDHYKIIPDDAVFACDYFVFMNPIEFVEAAYFRRTLKEHFRQRASCEKGISANKRGLNCEF